VTFDRLLVVPETHFNLISQLTSRSRTRNQP